jgi:hypothetical protein
MQLLLDNPDTSQNIENLIRVKSQEEHFAPIIELLIADIYHRNSLKAKFDLPTNVLHAVGRADYLSGHKESEKRRVENRNGLEEAEDIFVRKDDLIDEPSWTTPILNLVCSDYFITPIQCMYIGDFKSDGSTLIF